MEACTWHAVPMLMACDYCLLCTVMMKAAVCVVIVYCILTVQHG